MARSKAPKSESRVTLIEAINAPLGFFVLALLIVESFLGAIVFGLPQEGRMTGMWCGVGLFVYITALVAVLVWFKADHLTFDKFAHLRNRGKGPYGTEDEPISPASLFGASKDEKSEEEGGAK